MVPEQVTRLTMAVICKGLGAKSAADVGSGCNDSWLCSFRHDNEVKPLILIQTVPSLLEAYSPLLCTCTC